MHKKCKSELNQKIEYKNKIHLRLYECNLTSVLTHQTYLGLFCGNQLFDSFYLNIDLFKRMFGVKKLVVNFIRGQKTCK